MGQSGEASSPPVTQRPSRFRALWNEYRGDLGLLVALLALPFLCFADVVFEGKTFYVWDLGLTHFPQRVFAARMMREGQLALWNPYVLCGFPLLAEGQMGLLYPLSLLFVLPIASHFAFTCFILVHYSLAGVFTYLLVRSLAVGRAGAFVSALAFSLSGYLMAQLVNLPIMTGSVWLPLILLCFLRAVRARSYAWAAGAGLALALQVLTAQPQIVFYSLLILFIYACAEGIGRWREGVGPLSLFLITSAVGAGLAAPQWLPTYELQRQSLRAGGLDYAAITAFSLPPYQLIALLFPNFLGNPVTGYIGLPLFAEHHTYIGLLPLMGAALAWRRRREKEVAFFFILTLLSLPLALGNQTPLYLLLQYVPGFNLFRVPARWLLATTLALAVLSGYGFEALLEARGKTRLTTAIKRALLAGLGLALVSPALFIYKEAILRGINYVLAEVYDGLSVHVLKALVKGLTAFPDVPQSNWLARAFPFLLNPLVFFLSLWTAGGLLIYLYLRGTVPGRWFQRTALLLIVFDLFLTGGTTINAVEDPSYWQARDSTLFLKENIGLYRIYPLEMDHYPPRSLGEHFPTLYNIQSLGGSSPINLVRSEDFMGALRAYPRLLNLVGAKYILTEGREPERWPNRLRLVYAEEGLNIYENLDALPRAFIVHGAEVLPSPDAVLARLTDDGFDPSTTLLLEGQLALEGEKPASVVDRERSKSGERDHVRFIKYAPNRVVIEAELSQAGFLFLSDTYYPGWRAYVDGERGEMHRAHYLFRAVPLPAGRHTVEFEFAPLSFKIGWIVSLLTLTALISISLLFYHKGTRTPRS